MAQSETRDAKSAKNRTEDFFGFGSTRMESLLDMQKRVVESFEQFNRAQIERAKRETELASDFAAKVTGARSLPEVMNAYQDWLSKRMAMFAEDGQKLFQEGQRAVSETMKLMTNGTGRDGPNT